MKIRKLWTREELLLAINLYCKIPFGKIDRKNPEIIKLATLIGRTPGSVSYKLANFASIDPSLPRKGAANVSKLDKTVWNEFFQNWDEMAFKSEKLLATFKEDNILDENLCFPEGKTKEKVVKTRVNQRFFREMVLSSYDFSCCITGLPIKELLVASHIVPWAKDTKNRLNPRNGICLNPLHDKAFDAGLITLDESFKVLLSSRFNKLPTEKVKFFLDYDGVKIRFPKRFLPDQKFLNKHRTEIFKE